MKSVTAKFYLARPEIKFFLHEKLYITCFSARCMVRYSWRLELVLIIAVYRLIKFEIFITNGICYTIQLMEKQYVKLYSRSRSYICIDEKLCCIVYTYLKYYLRATYRSSVGVGWAFTSIMHVDSSEMQKYNILNLSIFDNLMHRMEDLSNL